MSGGHGSSLTRGPGHTQLEIAARHSKRHNGQENLTLNLRWRRAITGVLGGKNRGGVQLKPRQQGMSRSQAESAEDLIARMRCTALVLD